VQTLVAPARAFDRLAARPRTLLALGVATLASLAFAATAVPRIDFDAAATRALEMGPQAAEMTPHQLEEAVIQARKVGAIATWFGAALGPSLAILGATLALWLAFKLAGTRPALKATLAVAAHGLLPVFLAPLLALPALLLRAPIGADELPRLLPSSLAALLPAGASPVLAAALASVDLFGLWALALLAIGMVRVAGTTRTRVALVMGLLWVAQVGVLKVMPAAAVAAAKSMPRKGP
jgi:hypothetical protein